MFKNTLIFALCLGALLTGCAEKNNSRDKGAALSMANPASEFCVEKGGKVNIVDTKDGQIGYCEFEDGTGIEEWEYFRNNS